MKVIKKLNYVYCRNCLLCLLYSVILSPLNDINEFLLDGLHLFVLIPISVYIGYFRKKLLSSEGTMNKSAEDVYVILPTSFLDPSHSRRTIQELCQLGYISPSMR